MPSTPSNGLQSFQGKSFLITGGTGTMGQALALRLLQYQPRVIRLFSRDEHKQYVMKQRLGDIPNLRYLIGDVRDYERVSRAVEGIDIVIHTAALKHVPACEYNPFEAVQTNVIGTQNVILACQRQGVQQVLFTSSDKAIAPPNTMGATKLLAERLMIAAAYAHGSSRTTLCSVRFGNVLGSRGSAFLQFIRDLRAGRPVQVTDMDMTRFMMSVEEAVSLVLKALDMAHGGDVFVLKMPVVRLGTVVEALVDQFGKPSDGSLMDQIEVIGPRQGEKMFEELLSDDEAKRALEWEDMFVLPPWWEVRPHYDGAKSTTGEVYTSKSLPVLSLRETKEMLAALTFPEPSGEDKFDT
ncbi:MAG: hypothetical protein A2201_06540 [Alicyclobacillus sp. RIFOXYA1_FULL_53_8]|nr:MAG: hypothetical protein A2201_06540 [Alicyclobacillus sp. RIFOXYA1_FULL_53_8]